MVDKVCVVCGGKHRSSGLCKKCYDKDYYKKHAGEIIKKTHERYMMHGDDIKQRARELRLDDLDNRRERDRTYYALNKDVITARISLKTGRLPYSKNKACTSYLGVHVAERLIENMFTNIIPMPYGHKHYDFVCDKKKKIDVKSSCLSTNGKWSFKISDNFVADYFVFLAFDDRINLNVMGAWLIPNDINRKTKSMTIVPSTISKWDEYKIGIDKVINCCDTLKDES